MVRLFSRLRPVRPSTETVLDGFDRPKLARLRLDRFQRSADNYHVDVVLAPALLKATSTYVKALVREHVMRLWRQPVSSFSDSIVQAFQRVIVEHHNAVVKRARSDNRLERVQLFELALLKLLLQQVDVELSILRTELEDARSTPARRLSGQSLQLHQQAVVLARQSWHVRYAATRQLIRELMRIEHVSLRKVRKSVLGLSWPVPELMLANPLLQLEGGGDPRDFFLHYPLLLHDPDVAVRMNRCVLGAFAEWLPVAIEVPSATLPAESLLPGVSRQDQTGARSLLETERRVRQLFVAGELNECSSNWTDAPDNARALLGGDGDTWPVTHAWQQAGLERLQRDLNARLRRSIANAGLLDRVKASYELAAIYPGLGMTDGEVLLFDYLRGEISSAEFKRRLAASDDNSDPVQLLRRIERARKEYRRRPDAAQPQTIARFAADFMRYRRDLKFAWRALVGMDSIHLVTDEKAIAQVSDSDAVQVFCRDDVAAAVRGGIVGHVIIKVDVRGASQIVAQMQRRAMNPASHFSRYLYDPITRAVEHFGGQKVVVEADSIILSTLEHGGESTVRMAVARACCLAMKIIEFSGNMNAENQRIGLPDIELGVGISYADDAPTYLFDHGRKVAVSPAINQARRLSSCHVLLRETCTMPADQNLCVAAPVHGEGEATDTLVRYNVNGIEIDAAAFVQLHAELSLQRVTVRERKSGRPDVLYAGMCADTRGEGHLLVIRERPVKLWMGRQLLESHDDGRRYYEVVTESRLLEKVAKRYSAADDSGTLPRRIRGHSLGAAP